MKLSYEPSRENLRDFYDMLTPWPVRGLMTYYIFVGATNVLLAVFAYFCIAELDQVALAIAAGYFAVMNAMRGLPYSRMRRMELERSVAKKGLFPVTLEFTDAGMTETVCDVVSFCPWTSIVGVKEHKSVIVISLASEVYATVPVAALGETGRTAAEFVAWIEERRGKNGREPGPLTERLG